MITFEDKKILLGFSEKADGDLSFYSMSQESFASKWNEALPFGEKLPLPAYVQQIHTDEIAVLNDYASGQIKSADALMTSLESQPIGVFSADCLPVILYDESAGATIHAGWRGTRLDISGKTVSLMCERFGSTPAKIKAVIGPCIRQCCLEMGDEVYQEFVASDNKFSVFFAKKDKWFLDLQGLNQFQLVRAGLQQQNIKVVGRCTFCEGDSFFSFRRQKQRNGSMFSFLVKRK